MTWSIRDREISSSASVIQNTLDRPGESGIWDQSRRIAARPCITHEEETGCGDNDGHDRVEDEPGVSAVLVGTLCPTHSHFQPGTPCLPSSVTCIATCMNDTNIDEAGSDVPKMAMRVASSDGVLGVSFVAFLTCSDLMLRSHALRQLTTSCTGC